MAPRQVLAAMALAALVGGSAAAQGVAPHATVTEHAAALPAVQKTTSVAAAVVAPAKDGMPAAAPPKDKPVNAKAPAQVLKAAPAKAVTPAAPAKVVAPAAPAKVVTPATPAKAVTPAAPAKVVAPAAPKAAPAKNLPSTQAPPKPTTPKPVESKAAVQAADAKPVVMPRKVLTKDAAVAADKPHTLASMEAQFKAAFTAFKAKLPWKV